MEWSGELEDQQYEELEDQYIEGLSDAAMEDIQSRKSQRGSISSSDSRGREISSATGFALGRFDSALNRLQSTFYSQWPRLMYEDHIEGPLYREVYSAIEELAERLNGHGVS
jgi:hypothetical protein